MILKVLATRDRKVGCYGRPIYTTDDNKVTVEYLKRNIIGRPYDNLHLLDCELYYLGTFDDSTAKFDLLAQPEFLDDLHAYFPENIEEVLFNAKFQKA